MSDPTTYLCIRTGTARKAGLNATGTLSYAILKDTDSTEAYFIVTGNSSSGYYSRVAVPFSGIEASLTQLAEDQAFPAKALKPAFPSGKSANDAGFLLALLRHEGLLVPAPEGAHLSVRTGEWHAWRDAVLAAAGEPFELPTKQIKTTMNATDSSTTASITAAPPVLFLTSERNASYRDNRKHSAPEEDGCSHFLCMFDAEGHHNFGASDAWCDPLLFRNEAINRIAKRTGERLDLRMSSPGGRRESNDRG